MNPTKSRPRPDHPAIVLVYPRTGYDFGFGLGPPHSVLALTAYLASRGVPNRTVLLDQRFERHWESRLLAELEGRPLLVGISSMTGVQLKHALAVARFVRAHAPGTPIVFGGVHVSLLPEQTLASQYIDLGIVGDGERPLHALITALESGDDEALAAVPGLARKVEDRVIVNPQADDVDLDVLPVDRFLGTDVEQYVFKHAGLHSRRELDLGETSRGCPRRCGYCYNTVFHGGRWRGLDAEATISRIAYHVDKYRLESVWLRDDNFFVDVERATTVIEWVAHRGIGLYLPGITVQEFRRLSPETLRTLGRMKGSLLRFGAESGSDDVLLMIGKGIRAEEIHAVNRDCARYGVTPSFNFMVGFPGERPGDVLRTVEMMKRLKRENPAAQLNAVNLFTPYPGTALFDRYRAENPASTPSAVEDWTTFHHLNVKKRTTSRRERRMYENVATISYAISDTLDRSLRAPLRVLFRPFRAWFELRWRFNLFRFAPEVLLVRKLKKAFLAID